MFNDRNISWNGATLDRLSELLSAATVKFGVTSGALSFFNNKTENIVTEKGYRLKTVYRPNSIAAHGLLSADVFVIPDTDKVLSHTISL